MFKPGMEDDIYEYGHEGREPWDRCMIQCPYIWHRHQKIWINYGDWLITERDGTKYAMTEKEFKKHFEEIKDEVDLKLSALLDNPR